MKTTFAFLLLIFTTDLAFGQSLNTERFPLQADAWGFGAESVEFLNEDGIQKMKISNESGKVIAKDFEFGDGTIEFDTENTKALSFFFRMESEDENEYFYLRTARAGNPDAMDAFQYAPYIGGVLMWNTYPQFQANADYSLEEKNHFKFVISGSRMQIFINSESPTLEVDHLEGNFTIGKIGFEGDVEISNLKISKNEVVDLSPKAGIDPAANDPRYIREWAVSEPIQIPGKIDFSYEYLPSPKTEWRILSAERRGFLNLTRVFGKIEGKRLNWLKVKIDAEKAQTKKVDFGFLTDAWIFLNGQLVYLDKNLEGSPIAKKPDGRISIENTSFELDLKEGTNELLVGIASQAWGTGAMMRLEDWNGLKISPDPSFDFRYRKLPEEALKSFEGTYLIPSFNEKLEVTSDGYSLTMSSPVFNGVAYPKSESVFFLREQDLDINFLRDSASQIIGMEFVVDGEVVLTLEKI